MICNICHIDKDISEFSTSFKKARNKFETRKSCRKCVYIKNSGYQKQRKINEIESLHDNYIKDKLRRRGIPKLPVFIEIERNLIILLRTIKTLSNEKTIRD